MIGSVDNTLEKLIRFTMTHRPERIKVVTYADNRGKAEAVRQGFLQMLALGEYQWVAVC